MIQIILQFILIFNTNQLDMAIEVYVMQMVFIRNALFCPVIMNIFQYYDMDRYSQ